jgi:hypothetical protein
VHVPLSNPELEWVYLVASILVGVFLAWVFYISEKQGKFLVSTWLGMVISFILYVLFLYKYEGENDTEYFLIFLMIGLGTLTGLISLSFELIIIWSTSIGGSYMLMKSVSLVLGGYVNEFRLAE